MNTLRDDFAKAAMHAELITCGVPGEPCDALIEAAEQAGRSVEGQVAWNAYRMADAMLAEREDSEEEHPGEEVARQSMERAHGVIGT
ncbi:hypothetical protein ACFCQI_01800 [Rhodanobacter sp. FW102-FHT14D06]|uniref:Uncharacterized protein n=2 Tax=unclassified Rhodanobacter TaxID=2621553 RepID=A0AB74UQU0_9GAMM